MFSDVKFAVCTFNYIERLHEYIISTNIFICV